MTMKKIGNWDLVRTVVHNLGMEMDLAGEMAARRFSMKAEKLAVEHMEKQDLNWEPLDPKYLARKERQGFSTLILHRTTDYKQAITSWAEGLRGYAGVRRHAKNQEGESLADIAKVMEFGSKNGNIPPRPLWQPVLKEAIAWHHKNNQPAEIFYDNMQKKYGV